MLSDKDQTVSRQLVDLLDARGLKPGDRIPGELELAGLLGVSRPVVREAISALEATGLFATRKGSGRVLMPFSFSSALGLISRYVTPKGKWLLDLLAIRQVLENNMLPLAAARLSADDFDDLERLVGAMEAKALAGTYFGDEDRQFHLALYKALNNEVLDGILKLFWTMYDQLDIDELAHSQRLDETAAHHRRILTALKAGDIRRAQHHLDTHFYDTGYALSHIGPETQTPGGENG